MALSTIQLLPLRKLRTDAAASYKRMLAAGMPKKRLESAHRSRAAQQKLRNAYLAYKAGKGPFANFALDPDDSHHVEGTAIDSWDAQQDWLVKHGEPHGFTQDKHERWHFDYTAVKDEVLKALAASNARATARAKVKKVQAVLKVTRDGDPGPKTQAAWDDTMRRAKAGQFWYRRRFAKLRSILGANDTASTEAAWAKLVRAAK